MSTERRYISVSGIKVEIVRKDIKNLHLGVYPPNGRVRVAAPRRVSDEVVRLAIVGKIGWIKRKKAKFESQERQSKREMINGESHYYWGQRYRLRVFTNDGPPVVLIRNKTYLELHVRPELSAEEREKVLLRWYRQQLRRQGQRLLEKWESRLGVTVSFWGIKKMKTKWGSCNAKTARVWLNLELAKKPVQCLEYIIVHELNHLVERHHNERFANLMDKHLPQWQMYRAQLNATPLGHETWNN